ncbi:MAG: M61 family metallopeptidase [Thermonemataceae bacterium]
MVSYTISYQYPHQHFININITIRQIDQAYTYLQLPAWRPGRYELANYAKNIPWLKATTAEGKVLPIDKVTKDRWQIETKGVDSLEVTYQYYAAQLDAGGCWLDAQQLYLNFVNCLCYVEGRLDEPCEVALQLPDRYEIACGLEEVKKHTLQATDYHHLVDSPLIASADLKHQTYEVAETVFHIWIQGDWEPDWVAMCQEFSSFTKNQIDMMGAFPEKDYHFLFQILPYKFYHGVEHRNSTVIVLGPDVAMEQEEMYQNLLSVSSHELFHAWNVCKIRPEEMYPYNYAQENYFTTGFVVEGITSYIGDIFLVRSGVWKYQQYIEALNEYIKRHFDNFGRFNHSLVDSSFDLWLDGYTKGIPNRKVSIYAKGALVALILDLQIRQATANGKSLDDVMRKLWKDYAQQNKGYSIEAYQQVVEEVAGQSMQAYFDQFIFGKEPLENILSKLLEAFGFTLMTNFINKGTEVFSFQVVNKEGKTLVSNIIPASNASKVLSLNDELAAVDGRQIENNLTALITNKNRIKMHLFRNRQLEEVILEADDKMYFCEYYVQIKSNIDEAQQKNLKGWLNG